MELQEQDMRQLNGWREREKARERERERERLKRELNKGECARESDENNRLRKYNKERSQDKI